MKKIRGYIFSRPFMGERAPQHVQNIVIKDFCKNNQLEYLLSVCEYKMENSFLILNDLVKKMKNIDGIVAYSLYQLPGDYNYRNKILKKIIDKKKFIYFAVEKTKVNTKKDINNINVLWRLKKNIK